MWYTHTMKYYSAENKSENLIHATQGWTLIIVLHEKKKKKKKGQTVSLHSHEVPTIKEKIENTK